MKKTEFFRTALLVTVLVLHVAPALGDTNYTANSATVDPGNEVENSLSDTEQRNGINWKIQEEDTSGALEIFGDDNLQVDVDFNQVSEENKITKITFIHDSKTTGESFDWRVYNYNTGSYDDNIYDVSSTSLDYDAFSVCETGGCDRFDDPLNYISSNGLTETRFLDTEPNSGTQDNMSLNFQAVEVTTDDIPPDVRNASQNYSIITNNQTNLLEAEGYDNFNLSHAKLETNETGVFENKTDSYGSPEPYYSRQKWNETKFEWQNKSIEEEKLVRWRIWYNDTSGNFNATEPDSFTVRPTINYTGQISVNFNYTDLTERNIAGNRELSQTVNFTNKQVRTQDLDRSKRETINYSDTVNRSQNFKKDQKTSLKANNIQPRNTDNNRAFITGASLSEPVARLSGIERIFSQAITIDPQNFRFYNGIRTQISKLEYSDPVSREGVFQRILKNTYKVSNNPVRRYVGERLLTQGIDYSDDRKISSFLKRSLDQVLEPDDISTRTAFNLRDILNTFSLNQIYTRNTQANRIFSETIDFNSDFIRSTSVKRAFEDIYSQETNEANIFTGARTVRQTLTGDTQIFRSLELLRIDETVVGLVDDQTRLSILQKSAPAVDILQSDSSSRSLLSLRTLDQSLKINENVFRSFSYQRSLSEIFEPDTIQLRSFVGSRSFENTVKISNTQTRAVLNIRKIGEEIGYKEQIKQVFTGGRVLNSQVSVVAANRRRVVQDRVNTETYNELNVLSRSTIGFRESSVNIVTGEAVSQSADIARVLTQTTGIETVFIRNDMEVNRALSEVFSDQQVIDRQSLSQKLETVTVQYSENIQRNSSPKRIQDASLGIIAPQSSRSFIGARLLAESFLTANEQTRANTLARTDETLSEVTSSFEKTFSGTRVFSQAFSTIILDDRAVETRREEGFNTEIGSTETRTSFLERIEAESASYNTIELGVRNIIREVFVQFELKSQTTRIQNFVRLQEISLDILTSKEDSFKGARSLAETLQTNDDQVSASKLGREFNTPAPFAGSFTRSFTGNRFIQNTFFKNSDTIRKGSIERLDAFNTEIGQTTSKTVLNLRDQLEELSISNSFTRETTVSRLLQQEITSNNQDTFTSNLVRANSQILLPTATNARTSSINRIETVTATYISATTRITQVLRNNILEIKPESRASSITVVNRATDVSLGIITPQNRAFAGTRTLSEILRESDNQFSFSNLIRTEPTTAAFTGTLTRSFTGNRLISDVVSQDSEIDRALQNLRENSLDATIGSETFGTIVNLRGQLESFTASTETDRQVSTARLLQQKISSNNQETVSSSLARVTSQILLSGTTSTRTASTNRLNTVTTTYSDISIRVSDVLRNQILQISPEPQTTRTVTFNRQRQNGIGILATGTRGFTGSRIITETFQTEENQFIFNNLIRTDETITDFTGSLRRSFTGNRLFTDIFSIDPETDRTNNLDREDSFETTINQEASRIIVRTKQQLETFNIEDEEIGQPDFLRLLEQQIESRNQETITSNLARTTTEALLPGTGTERATTLEREEPVSAVYSTTTLRITKILRSEILRINPEPQTTRTTSLNRAAGTSLGIIAPQNSRIFTGTRLLADSFLTSNEQTRTNTIERTDETLSSLTSASTRTYSGIKVISDIVSQDSETSRFLENLRENNLDTNVGSTTTRIAINLRKRLESFSTNPKSTRQVSAARLLRQEVTSENQEAFSSSLARTTSQILLLGETSTRATKTDRINTVTTAYSTVTVRVSDILRNQILGIDSEPEITRNTLINRQQENGIGILATGTRGSITGIRTLTETFQINEDQLSLSDLVRTDTNRVSITGSSVRSFTGSRLVSSIFTQSEETFRTGSMDREDILETTVSQTASRTALNFRKQLETAVFDGEENRLLLVSRLFEQEITSGDQQTTVSNLARTTTEVLLSSAFESRATALGRIESVSTVYSTEISTVSDLLRDEDLQINTRSQTTRTTVINRAVDAGFGFIVPQSRTFTGTRGLTENFFTESSESLDSNLIRTDLTTATFTGSFARSFTGNRIISDIFSQDPETSRFLENLRETGFDTVIGTETTRSITNLRDQLETFTLGSETIRQVSSARIFQQEITLESQETITSNLVRETSQILLSGKTATRTASINRINTVTTAYASTSTRIAEILRDEILQIRPASETTRNTVVSRFQAADIGVLPTATNSISGIRTLTETIQTSEDRFISSNLRRTEQTITAFTGSLTRSFTGSRLFTDVFSIDPETDRTSNLDREDSFETTVNQEISRTVLRIREELETFGIESEELNQQSFLRLLEQQVNSENQETVTSDLARTATEALLTGTGTERTTTLERKEPVTAVYSSTTLRITDILRNEILQIDTEATATGLPELKRIVIDGLTAGTTETRTVLNQRLNQLSLDGIILNTRNTFTLRSAAETIAGTETVSTEAALDRLLESGISAGTMETRFLSQQRVLETQTTIASNTLSLFDLRRTVTDSYISTEEAFYTASLGRTVLQDLSLTRNIQTRSALARLNVETFTGINTPVRILNLNRNEQIEIDSEVDVLASSILSRFNAENLAIEELSKKEPEFSRGITTLVSGAETIITEKQFGRSRILGLETEILADRSTALQRVTNGIIDGSFTDSQTIFLNRLLNNQLDITGFESRSLLQDRFTELEFGVDQNVETTSVVSRLTDTAVKTVTPDPVTSSNLDRIINSNLGYTGEESVTLRVYSVISQPVGAGFDQTVSSKLERLLEQDLSVENRVERFVSVERILDSGFQTTSVELREGLAVFRVTEADIEVDNIAESVRAVDRNMVELITGTGSENRDANGFRKITETVGPEINNIAGSRLERILNTETSLGYKATSISALGRTVTNGLGLTGSETTQGLYSRTLEKTLFTDSSIDTARDMDRILTQNLLQEDQSLGVSTLPRINEETLDISLTEDRSSLTSRFTASTLSYGTLFDSEQNLGRSVTQGLVETSNTPRIYSSLRIYGTNLGFNESVDPGFKLVEAVIETGLGFNQDNTRTVSMLRVVSEEYGQTSIIDSILDLLDRSSDDDDGGGSSGGGGGGTIIDPIEDEEQAELSFTDEKLSIKLKPGETSEAELELENTGDIDALADIDVERLSVETVDALTLEQTEVNVPAGSSVKTGLDIVVPGYLSDENLTNRVLERSVQASANNSSATIPVNVLIESGKQELLDVKMKLSDNTIKESENTDYNLEIFNLGQSGRVDIELFTTVRNSTGQVVHEKKEELAVQTSASIVRNLDLDLPPGTYRIETKASYSGKEASSYSTLIVREEDDLTDSIPVGDIMLALLALLVISSVAGFLKRKRRYDKLAQSKVEEIKEYSKKQDIDFGEILKKESQEQQEIPVSVVDSGTETESTETVQKTEEEPSRPPVKISDVDREKDREEIPARVSSKETEEEVSTDDEVFVCDECNEVFDSERDLEKHKQTVKDGHQNSEAFICDECKHVFDSERDLEKHKQTVNTEKERKKEEKKVEELRDQMMELEKNIMEIKSQQKKEKRKLENRKETEDGTEEKIIDLKDKLGQLEDRKQGLEADVLAEKMKKDSLREDLKQVKSKLESLDENLEDL
ncbi:MAG: hypothetical protein BRC29_05405 [Nanohaloarchaea archaeon SW_7_43_1]|nr:MAG: hypothetical protein BRC29_05405 [Nanohaloarchaea archaeon SW_7_43_1]